jgi:hypothetical protein
MELFCAQVLITGLLVSYYDLIQDKLSLTNWLIFNCFSTCVIGIYILIMFTIKNDNIYKEDTYKDTSKDTHEDTDTYEKNTTFFNENVNETEDMKEE